LLLHRPPLGCGHIILSDDGLPDNKHLLKKNIAPYLLRLLITHNNINEFGSLSNAVKRYPPRNSRVRREKPFISLSSKHAMRLTMEMMPSDTITPSRTPGVNRKMPFVS